MFKFWNRGGEQKHPIPVIYFHSLEEFLAGSDQESSEYQAWRNFESNAILPGDIFEVEGYCYYCKRPSSFLVDYLYASGEVKNGKPIPNWRERLICKKCELNNRTRACIHFLEENCQAGTKSIIYITEQSTPLYKSLRSRHPLLTGSEYLGDKVPFGFIDPESGYRNENVAKLSFPDSSQDFVLTFDVLEHVPAYDKALNEFYRVLKPGGCLLFTVPFALGHENNIVRARESETGEIIHLMEPEYHGDPINNQGCLCFYIFSWELLRELRSLGFVDVKANYYWSDKYVYMGEHQVIFSAIKQQEQG